MKEETFYCRSCVTHKPLRAIAETKDYKGLDICRTCVEKLAKTQRAKDKNARQLGYVIKNPRHFAELCKLLDR
jgi:hypothetical protein